jgi:aminopeptidase-like protein
MALESLFVILIISTFSPHCSTVNSCFKGDIVISALAQIMKLKKKAINKAIFFIFDTFIQICQKIKLNSF